MALPLPPKVPKLAELVITDGTELVDLLHNFNLAGWQVATATYKEGGVWQDSPIADGRRLVQRYYANLTEQLQLVVKSGRINSAVSDLNRLRQIFEKAADYWTTDWQDTPVWLEARAQGESNRRYGLVMAGQAPNDPNPNAPPFGGPFGVVGLIEAVIEHAPWMDVKPTATNATLIGTKSAQVSGGDDYFFGNVESDGTFEPVSDGTAYISNSDANHRGNSNLTNAVGADRNYISNRITHVFSDTFASRLNRVVAGTVPATTVLVDTAAASVGEAIYFGAEYAAGQPRQFFSIVVNLSVGMSGFDTEWEWWNGTVWESGSWELDDQSNELTLTGEHVISWKMPAASVAEWQLSNQNVDSGSGIVAVNAYWVRLKINGIPGPLVAPVQAERNIYSISTPWTEISEDEVAGTLPALARTFLTALNITQNIDRVLVGLRSTSRGESFSHIIALDESTFVGPTYAAVPSQADVITLSAGLSLEAVSPGTNQNRVVCDASTATSGETIDITFGFGNNAARRTQWLGKFRTLVRYTSVDAAAGDFTVQAKLMRGNFAQRVVAYSADPFPLNDTTNDYAIEWIGVMDTKGNTSNDQVADYAIRLEITFTAAAVSAGAILYLYDLILLPIDEFSADIKIDETLPVDTTYETLVLDSLMSKWQTRGYFNGNTTGGNFNDDNEAIARVVSPGPSILQAQARQRMYFLMITTVNGQPTAPPWLSMQLKLQHQSRYHSMRGDQ